MIDMIQILYRVLFLDLNKIDYYKQYIIGYISYYHGVCYHNLIVYYNPLIALIAEKVPRWCIGKI